MASANSNFLQLLNQHRGIVHKIARLYADTADDQQDLYHDVVAQALEAWPRFEQRSAFSTWLYRVALNTALTWRRKEEKRMKAEAQSEWHVTENDPRQAQIDWLYQHMRRLDPISRMLLTLRLEGYDMQQIAEITGINSNNATVKIHRAKNLLSTWLQQHPLTA